MERGGRRGLLDAFRAVAQARAVEETDAHTDAALAAHIEGPRGRAAFVVRALRFGSMVRKMRKKGGKKNTRNAFCCTELGAAEMRKLAEEPPSPPDEWTTVANPRRRCRDKKKSASDDKSDGDAASLAAGRAASPRKRASETQRERKRVSPSFFIPRLASSALKRQGGFRIKRLPDGGLCLMIGLRRGDAPVSERASAQQRQ